MSEERELTPIEQQTIQFYGKSIMVVRLSDGQAGVVFRFLCENLQIDTTAQIARIRRTEAISDDLVFLPIETEGGIQKMAVLILHAVPFWLAGIDPKRVREEIRPEILRYQREVVDVLYAWAQSSPSRGSSTALVSTEPIAHSVQPEQNAPLAEWRDYYLRMAAITEWQIHIEEWRGGIESRLEGVEALTGLIPEILERLGPPLLTPAHQRQVQVYVHQLHQQTGKPYATIYDDLKTAFQVAKYNDVLEQEWPQLAHWFQVQLEKRRK